MIALPPGARVWLCNGVTDMRKGMPGLALLVQEGLGRDPHAGDLHVFRGRAGAMVKILWHDGVGMSLYIKRLARGRLIRPTPKDGCVAISAAQLACLPDGGDWRTPRHASRPAAAGQVAQARRLLPKHLTEHAEPRACRAPDHPASTPCAQPS